jgi:hypothetical protein
MTNRRHTRWTNAFRKKIENHFAAVTLGYFAYNFIKIHRTLRCTPAMAAGVTDRLWEVCDLVASLEASERRLEKSGKRGWSTLLIFLLALSATGCLAPWIIFRIVGNGPLMDNVFVFSALIVGPAWMLVASLFLWRYGKRGLCVLIGLPFALGSTALYLLLMGRV